MKSIYWPPSFVAIKESYLQLGFVVKSLIIAKFVNDPSLANGVYKKWIYLVVELPFVFSMRNQILYFYCKVMLMYARSPTVFTARHNDIILVYMVLLMVLIVVYTGSDYGYYMSIMLDMNHYLEMVFVMLTIFDQWRLFITLVVPSFLLMLVANEAMLVWLLRVTSVHMVM